MGTSKRVIRSVNVASAAKIAGGVSALAWSILGLLFVCASLCTSAFASSSWGGYNSGGAFAGSIVGTIVFYFLGFVLYGVGGLIVGAIYAFMYNIVAARLGGLEFEVSEPGSPAGGMPAMPPSLPTNRY